MKSEKLEQNRATASGDEVEISPEAYAIILNSGNIRKPLNQSQKEIKTLIDEIYFWRGKFNFMIGENNGLRYCLGLEQRGMVVSSKEQSKTARTKSNSQSSRPFLRVV